MDTSDTEIRLKKDKVGFWFFCNGQFQAPKLVQGIGSSEEALQVCWDLWM